MVGPLVEFSVFFRVSSVFNNLNTFWMTAVVWSLDASCQQMSYGDDYEY